MPKIQACVIFKGRVQGVGFRFTVEKIALDLGIAGWVKNLADGNVEVVIEAEKGAIDDFMQRIRGCFSDYIRDVEVSIKDTTQDLKGFQVRF